MGFSPSASSQSPEWSQTRSLKNSGYCPVLKGDEMLFCRLCSYVMILQQPTGTKAVAFQSWRAIVQTTYSPRTETVYLFYHHVNCDNVSAHWSRSSKLVTSVIWSSCIQSTMLLTLEPLSVGSVDLIFSSRHSQNLGITELSILFRSYLTFQNYKFLILESRQCKY